MERLTCAGLAAAAILFMTGCDGCSAGNDDEGGGAGGGASGPGPGSGGSTGAFTDTTGTGSSGCIECSADLHNVVDCDGNVILACPPDQGCSPDGTCVPACQSAELNKSTIGCDFFSVTPGVIAESRGSCFAVMIANTWTSPISIMAELGGMSIDASAYTYIPEGQGASLTYTPLAGGMLEPNRLGILFLSKYESGDIFQVDCPVPQALEMNTQVDDGTNSYTGITGLGSAFHISTTAPIVAYDVYPWGGAQSYVSSATLLLPTPTWGTNFVTADAWGPMYGNPWTQIVASQDATTITMVPVVDVVGGNGLPGGPANTPMTFTLNRGQVAQFLQPTRLAGSVLQSDKPVSVWGGSSCMNIPDGVAACDAAHQQLLPVQALGNEYVAVRYPTRGGDDSAPYMIVGMVDGTAITYDPAAPPGAPAMVNQGQVAVFFTDQPFHVRSQDVDHPFYIAAYMTGALTNPATSGDPEYVNLVPPQQYLSSYLFATDPTYADTSLVFVRKKAADGTFKDVHLDCMDPVTGWQPLDAAGNFEIARVMIVQAFQPVGSCANGAHTATSEVPFGLTAWGYDIASSYAYPAGMSVEPINTVVVPPVPQ
jgi:hypothetical protein